MVFSGTSIYDEIYGYIPIEKLELELIDNPLFQRLNYLKQLGTAYRVFPGAQHTRFSHSLGVMHVMDKMVNSRSLKCKLDAKAKEKMKLAALLHDIGHYPFSHVTETVITEQGTKKERKHEKFGEYIINNSSITKTLSDADFDPKEIAQIITGESSEPLFNQLMSSDLDADRIDYLMRDSIHTGVAYGRFDVDRLIHTLTLDNNGELAVIEKGIHSIENYVVGRYLMYAVVYTHKTINAFNEIIEHICEKCIGSTFPSYDQIQKLLSDDEIEFAKFNDNQLLEKILSPESEDIFIKEASKMFLKREALTIAREAIDLSEGDRGEKDYFLLDEYRKENKIKELAEKSEVPQEWVFHNSTRTKLPSLKPFFHGLSHQEEPEENQREMSKAIRIVDKDGNSEPLVKNQNSLVRHLSDMKLDKVRIYTKEEYVDQLMECLEEELSE